MAIQMYLPQGVLYLTRANTSNLADGSQPCLLFVIVDIIQSQYMHLQYCSFKMSCLTFQISLLVHTDPTKH